MRKQFTILSLAVCLLLGSVAQADIESGLVAHYDFEDLTGTTIPDVSGNGHDGISKSNLTTEADPVIVPGPVEGLGDAMDFDNGNYVEIANHVDFQQTTEYSLSLWTSVDAMSGGNWATMFCIADQSWRIARNNNTNMIGFHASPEGSDWGVEGGTDVVNPKRWVHLVGIFDNGAMTLYVDGVVDGTATKGSATNVHTGDPVTIGAQINNGTLRRFWDGQIDEVRFYNRVLSADDVKELYEYSGIKGPAKSPTPSDEATDVLRDNTSLNWKAGPYAVEHDIYFGKDAEDVNNATPASDAYKGTQALEATSYDLDRLELGVTYYWRIDEVNDAHPDKVWKGFVWSFTVEPEGIPVDVDLLTASGSAGITTEPNVVVNGAGLTDGMHGTVEETMWMTNATAPGDGWLQIDMNEPAKLAGLQIWNYNSVNESGPIPAFHLGVKDVLIEYTLDGETWESAGEVVLAQAPGADTYEGETISLGNIVAKSVKLTIQSSYGSLGLAGLSEVQLLAVPTAAREMMPAEGSNVSANEVVLTWRAGRDAATHQVYISTDPNAVLEETAPMIEVTEPTLAPDVAMDMTYYWKVVEVNDLETISRWASPVQSFATNASIIVDDMESYPTDDGLQIWQAWVDGFENNNQDNGSIVGDFDGLPETGIVYAGSQSLNMQYGVNAQPDSWATHTFDPAEDWSKYNIQSLSLKVFGAMDNQVGEFYVLVNDTRYAYEGAANDLKAGQWVTFTIALDSPTNVQSLTVGVKGGNGTVYVDDIRLYPLTSELISAVEPSKDELIAWYNFDDNFNDSSGEGRHGTAIGGAMISDNAERGKVLNLDGISGCVDLGPSGDPNQGFNPMGSFTVSAWVKADTWSSNWVHTIMGNRGENGVGWQVRRRNNPTITFTVRGTTGGDDPTGRLDVSTYLSQWIQVTSVYDNENGQRRVYINGLLDMSINDGGTPTATTHNVYIGARANGGNTSPEAYFTGDLDDVRFYNRALTQEEALSLAGRTTPIYKPF